MNAHSSALASAAPLSPQESRRAREQEERRIAILRAAETVFAGKGYHGASISEIATEAGFAAGTIYLYFKDKAELYGSVILAKMRQLITGARGALTEEASPSAGLRAFVRFHFSFHQANRPFFEIFLTQTQMEQSPLHRQHWEEMETLKREQLTSLQECIAAGQLAGELRAGDARMFALAFLGMILQMVRQFIREGGQWSLTDCADFAADCFLQGAAAGTSAPTRDQT